MHVTVLMPVYNGASTLEAAITSIQQQTYNDWDMLIVDDASSDGTPDLLSSIAAKDARITVVRNEKNKGIAGSLNVGWRLAKGELIARMDADDLSLPDRLSNQVAFLANHPDVSVLGTGAYLVSKDGKSLGCHLRPAEHEQLVRRIYKENPFIHPTVMVRRSFYIALGGYDERVFRADDYDLWLRGWPQFRYHNLQVPLLRYTVSGTPLRQAISGSFAIARAAYRDGRFLTHGWLAGRFLLGVMLGRRLREASS